MKTKNVLLSLAIVFMSVTGFSANPFKIVIKTNNTGVSTSSQFKLPLISGYTYNFVVSWGDGTFDTITAYDQAHITHTYPVAGCYPIEISGTCPYFCFNDSGDKLKLIDIRQWGDVGTTNVVTSYKNCSNLIGTFEDTLHLSGLTNHSLEDMFCGCLLFNGHVEWWDVSTVTSLHNFTYGCAIFNRPIGQWGRKTSNVTDFSTFLGKTMFNSELDSLDTHNGSNFYAMFYGNQFFNKTLDSLNFSNATDMSYMLAYCYNYNYPFTTQNTKRNKTFQGFLVGYPASYGYGLHNEFNSNIDSLDFDSTTTINSMLYGNEDFNQPTNLTIPLVTNAVNFLYQSYSMSVANTDSLLINIIGWDGVNATKSVQSNVTFRADAHYTKAPSAAADAYAYLKYTKGWTFLGLAPTP